MNVRIGLSRSVALGGLLTVLAASTLTGCAAGLISRSAGTCVGVCPDATPADTRDASQISTDTATTRAVRKKLERDPTLKPFNLSVDTHTGVVTLRGYVDNVDQRKAAEAVARSAGPVTRVRNLVGVRQ